MQCEYNDMVHEIFLFRGVFVICQRREWQPTPVLLPEKSHGLRILVGYSPCGRKESATTERLHFTMMTPRGLMLLLPLITTNIIPIIIIRKQKK